MAFLPELFSYTSTKDLSDYSIVYCGCFLCWRQDQYMYASPFGKADEDPC